MQTKTVVLRLILQERHPDLLLQGDDGQGSTFTIFRLGFHDLDAATLLTSLELAFGEQGDEMAYLLSMREIDIISPSAANALMTGLTSIAKQRNVPIIFTEVREDALQGLQTVRNLRPFEKVFWAVDIQGHHNFVGAVQERLKGILNDLYEKGGASASALAEASGENSKKGVNKYSVYLQELYSVGLVIREKIIGSDRTDGEPNERGWTYKYHPAYRVLLSSSSL